MDRLRETMGRDVSALRFGRRPMAEAARRAQCQAAWHRGWEESWPGSRRDCIRCRWWAHLALWCRQRWPQNPWPRNRFHSRKSGSKGRNVHGKTGWSCSGCHAGLICSPAPRKQMRLDLHVQAPPRSASGPHTSSGRRACRQRSAHPRSPPAPPHHGTRGSGRGGLRGEWRGWAHSGPKRPSHSHP